MSKSLGNFVTVQDVLDRNDPEAFRWFLLSAQYRGPIQFDTQTLEDGRVVFPAVDEAERRVDYVFGVWQRLEGVLAAGLTAPHPLPAELRPMIVAAEAAEEQAGQALDDDLNSPVALAALGELARLGNELCDLAQKRRKDPAVSGGAALVARRLRDSLLRVADQLGLLQVSFDVYDERTRARRLKVRTLTLAVIEEKVQARAEARKNKDFALSDRIRDELAALGVALHDGPDGTQWSIAP
jgi:cysteinyl-tRNA synthetase